LDEDELADARKSGRIADREDDYKAQRIRQLSPAREEGRGYADALKEVNLGRERKELSVQIEKRRAAAEGNAPVRKRRWDMPTPDVTSSERSEWDEPEKGGKAKASRWDATPLVGTGGETPRRAGGSRWDATPVGVVAGGATPLRGSDGAFGFPTGPESFFPSGISLTPEQSASARWERELDARNRPLSDEELDAVLPGEGYTVLPAPASYAPVRTPARKLVATPMGADTGGFRFQEDMAIGAAAAGLQPRDPELPTVKAEDYQYFAKLFDEGDPNALSLEEARERKVMRLLLKIKSGTPQQRKVALRQITEKAKEFGPGPLFDQLLPLLMSPALEDQERHLLVKVIDRVLYGLEEMVRPYVHKILVVVEPLLIEEDHYTRLEGREIIANLSKAAGLATMIATLRPDIEHADEYVRNTTARAFAVVASALGIPALLPFLRAVCRSKKSWQARHTGIKVVQQAALLLGCGILPHLRALVECIAPGLEDEQLKVRTITALAIAALAEAATPHGIESIDPVLKGLWRGLRENRGKALAAYLKAVGQVVPLMDAEYAAYYAKDLLGMIVRHFASPDDEMKRIILRVIRQCALTPGVNASFLRAEVVAEFFRHFWTKRMALDRRNARPLVETTVDLAAKVGPADIVGRLAGLMKDDSEAFRRLAVEATGLIVARLGAADIDTRLEEQLLDGLVFAFQEQASEEQAHVVLHAFGEVFRGLGPVRVRPYLTQVSSVILWRLGNRSAKIRQLAADLVAQIAPSMVAAQEETALAKIGLVLYENLGEEYPDVLGSILGALKAIVAVIGMARMSPPVKDLLPRLTPILRNRHEKVQENCILLVGRIADRASEAVSAREWMRICFELLDILKAQRKSVRRAAVNAFGYIAKAVGPQDVLAALLNNLRVQERQNRVCTTIAIAIVAEACAPFTVLPALMNEYRVPELNVQNGVLKALAFLFEYIGEAAKDYVFAVTPLLEDALSDRDQVHRQTAAAAVKHLALGVVGFGCEEALLHLLNYLLPNLFDNSPHLLNALVEAMDALRLPLGPGTMTLYLVQGLAHPARRVRDIYWKLFNNLYISAQDALIPFYPAIDDDEQTGALYQRHILDIVI
jgi:splicing factor 3B subunit 1